MLTEGGAVAEELNGSGVVFGGHQWAQAHGNAAMFPYRSGESGADTLPGTCYGGSFRPYVSSLHRHLFSPK